MSAFLPPPPPASSHDFFHLNYLISSSPIYPSNHSPPNTSRSINTGVPGAPLPDPPSGIIYSDVPIPSPAPPHSTQKGCIGIAPPFNNPVSHHPNITLTVWISSDAVGALIGKSGASIYTIQQAAIAAGQKQTILGLQNHANHLIPKSHAHLYAPSVRVKVPTTPNTPCLWSPVVVEGPPSCCFAIFDVLQTLMEPEYDGVVLEIPLPRSRHATIIGNKGATIRTLSADNNVRINVPPKNEFLPPVNGDAGGDNKHRDTPNPSRDYAANKKEVAAVTLEGSPPNVAKCLHELLGVMHAGQLKHELEKKKEQLRMNHQQQQQQGAPEQQQQVVSSTAGKSLWVSRRLFILTLHPQPYPAPAAPVQQQAYNPYHQQQQQHAYNPYHQLNPYHRQGHQGGYGYPAMPYQSGQPYINHGYRFPTQIGQPYSTPNLECLYLDIPAAKTKILMNPNGAPPPNNTHLKDMIRISGVSIKRHHPRDVDGVTCCFQIRGVPDNVKYAYDKMDQIGNRDESVLDVLKEMRQSAQERCRQEMLA